jgi:tetratricopeptide (TPR) repeat protein
MRCLEKDRARRYETASGLAADLKRHLNHEPVVARPPSTVYRLQRAFRRNRLAFSAGAAVVASLCVAVISLAVAFESSKRALEAAQRSAFKLGLAAVVGCDEEEATQALADAEQSRLPEAKLRYLRGMHLVTTAQPARAIPELEAVRRLEPDNVAALGLLATARMEAFGWSAYEPLVPELERARPVTPDDKLFLGQAWAMVDVARGLPLLDEALEAKGSPMARIIRAGAKTHQAAQTANLELMRDALDDIAAAQAWRPHSIAVLIAAGTTHRVAAQLHRRAGQVTEAEIQARLAEHGSERLESFYPNLQALRARLDHLILTGNMEGAIIRARRWSGEIPGWNLLYGLVYPLLRHGEFEEAFELTRPPQTDELMQFAHFLAAIELPTHRAEATQILSQVSTNAPDSLNGLFPAVAMNLLTDQLDQAKALAQGYLKGAGWLDRLLGPSMRRVVRYLAGDLSEEALLQGATSALALGTAHHFVGLHYLQRRDPATARRHLELSREVGEAGGPGMHISTFILERLDQDPHWPPTLPKGSGRSRP